MVTVTDDEEPGVTLSPSSLTVTEGLMNTYTVELSVIPTADVTVSVTAGGDVTVSPSALTFSTSSWNTAQTVTVTGTEDDDAAEGAGSVAHAVVAGSAPEYVGATLDGVMVTVNDNDDPGVDVVGVDVDGHRGSHEHLHGRTQCHPDRRCDRRCGQWW